MRVVVADIEQAALDTTVGQIGAVAIRTDVSSADSVQALADTVKERFGSVHLVFNNAGVASTGRIAEMPTSDWNRVLGVNLWGVIHGIRSFLPLLQANADGGHLVNTASIAGFHPPPELGGYTVPKFAVVALSETLALELKAANSKVGVTVLCPGPVSSYLGSCSAADAALVAIRRRSVCSHSSRGARS